MKATVGKISLYLLFIGIGLVCTDCFAQELEFHSLSERVQLPASECYNVLQDRDGYIWFASEAGYCRYSSNYLKVFGAAEGIPEKVVYASCIAPDGKLWVATRERRFLYFDGKSFIEPAFSQKFIVLTKSDWGYALRLFFYQNNLVLVDQNNATLINLTTENIKIIPRKKTVFQIFEFGNNIAWSGMDLFDCVQPTIEFLDRKIRVQMGQIYSETLVFHFGERIILATRNRLIEFTKDNQIHSYILPGRVLSAIQDAEGNILLGLLNEGLLLFQKGNLNSPPIQSLKKMSVSGIAQDVNGGIWCTTLEKGIFYCQSTDILTYRNIEELSGRVSILKYIPGQNVLAVRNSSNKILKITPTKVYDFVSIPTIHTAYNLQNFGRYLLLAATPSDKFINIKTGVAEEFSQSDKHNVEYSYGVSQKGNHTICFRYKDIAEFINRKYSRTIYQQYQSGGRIRNMVPINDHQFLLFGTKLFILFNTDPERIQWLKMPSTEITCALNGPDGSLILGTKDKGLFLYDIPTQTFKRVGKMIPVEVILSLYRDHNAFVWVGTNQGAYRLSPDLRRCINISKNYALPLTETRQITEDGPYIYLGTNDGVYSIHLKNDLNTGRIHAPGLEVSQEKQSVKIHIDNNFFEEYASTWYFLEGEERLPRTRFSGSVITFNAFDPGDYTFYCYVKTANGKKSRTSKISFTIEPTLFQTFWFRSLAVILTLGIVFLTIRWRITQIRKKEEEKTRINTQLADFQMSALQAQMNPHFIFNAINTIQSYILTRNRDEAYKYLNKFSNLIRLVLHHSQEKLITLHEELEVIRTYLELEHARFSNFEYELIVAEEIDIHEVQVPPMVIQPYIENAIWHGLNNLTTRTGKLVLDFSLDEEYLQIVIEDNGVGRKEAAKHQKTIHKSVGLKITQKRLETLKNLFDEGEAVVEVLDKIEKDGVGGTIVIVRIPLL